MERDAQRLVPEADAPGRRGIEGRFGAEERPREREQAREPGGRDETSRHHQPGQHVVAGRPWRAVEREEEDGYSEARERQRAKERERRDLLDIGGAEAVAGRSVGAGEADRERGREDGEERDRRDSCNGLEKPADQEETDGELDSDQGTPDERRQASGNEAVLAHAVEEVARRPGLFEPREQADDAQARAEHEERNC